jgi:TetR/AcrR family transcriptional repressor of bet genes
MQVSKTSSDKRKSRGEESRRQILHAAVTSVAALGLSNLTLDRVAERVGVSRGLVVFHFKSKNKLLEEVLNFLGVHYSNGWETVYSQQGHSSMEKLLLLVDYDINFAYDNPEYISAWHAFWGETKGNLLYRNVSSSRDQHYADGLEKLISNLIVEGQYDPNEMDGIFLSLGAMLFGIFTESHLDYDPDDRERYKKAVRLFISKFFPKHAIDG